MLLVKEISKYERVNLCIQESNGLINKDDFTACFGIFQFFKCPIYLYFQYGKLIMTLNVEIGSWMYLFRDHVYIVEESVCCRQHVTLAHTSGPKGISLMNTTCSFVLRIPLSSINVTFAILLENSTFC